MNISDHDTFGMYVGLKLRTPTNLMQRFALWSAQRELGTAPDDAQVLPVVRSLQVLNQYARTTHGDYRSRIYWLKQDCLHALYAYGYLLHLDVEQQVLKCHSCTRGIWEYGTDHEARCWKCNGTGIYRRIRLLKFTICVAGHNFVFHQPDEIARWAWDLLEPKLLAAPVENHPKYQEFAHPRVMLSNWQLQTHLMRVANFTASRMLFEEVTLRRWQDAVSHDAKAIANFLYQRVRYRVRDLRYLLENHDELPF